MFVKGFRVLVNERYKFSNLNPTLIRLKPLIEGFNAFGYDSKDNKVIIE